MDYREPTRVEKLNNSLIYFIRMLDARREVLEFFPTSLEKYRIEMDIGLKFVERKKKLTFMGHPCECDEMMLKVHGQTLIHTPDIIPEPNDIYTYSNWDVCRTCEKWMLVSGGTASCAVCDDMVNKEYWKNFWHWDVKDDPVNKDIGFHIHYNYNKDGTLHSKDVNYFHTR